jgi:hypothetical protein
MRCLLTVSLFFSAVAFQPGRTSPRKSLALSSGDGGKGEFPNPMKEFSDMMSNLDDVIDDFFNKRMGNGEVFYGKRKYKPSERPNTEGFYNGMGISDKTKIDVARESKEQIVEARRRRMEEE